MDWVLRKVREARRYTVAELVNGQGQKNLPSLMTSLEYSFSIGKAQPKSCRSTVRVVCEYSSHGTASERERPRSRRRLRPQKLAEYRRKTEGTFDCQTSLVFGRRRTAEGGKGTDVRPAGRVHPGEAATEQKQGEVDGTTAQVRYSCPRAWQCGSGLCTWKLGSTAILLFLRYTISV
jgi:hypothetical protein